MKVAEIDPEAFRRRFRGEGVAIRSGPFVTRIASELAELADPVHTLYAEFPVADPDFAHFHVRLASGPGLYRRLCRQIVFSMDWETAFHPMHRSQALPLLEWGMNWCIYRHAHQFLLIHSAVVQKGPVTCILPGTSGAGKSTLCAALVSRGWRLLSDELALLRPGHVGVLPIARPVSLKNESISLMREFAPDQVFGPRFGNTRKGEVAHMRPPAESVRRMDEEAAPTHIVFPAYRTGATARFESVPKSRAFYRLADCSLNYVLWGEEGFRALAELVERCACRTFEYAALDDAIRMFDALAAAPALETVP